ncbi:MAG: hypothetical protein ACOCP4_07045 [Candidatus Woesearchaeota archaeon]
MEFGKNIELLLKANKLDMLGESCLKEYINEGVIKKNKTKKVCEKCRVDCEINKDKFVCPECGYECDLHHTYSLTKKAYESFILNYFNIPSNEIHQKIGRVFRFKKDSLLVCCIFLLDDGVDHVYKELLFENKDNNQAIFLFYQSNLESMLKELIPKISKSDIIVTQKLNASLENTRKNISKLLGIMEHNIELENNLLKEIKANKREFKSLVSKIYSNPRFLINLTSNFLLNETYDTSSLEWQDYESLARVIFSILYDSDINIGGGGNKGDIYFCTRFQKIDEYGDIKIIGIGDTKFSKDPNLNDEKTEKYTSLLEALRKKLNSYDSYSVELIFFYLNKVTYFEDLVDRIYPKIKKNEFLILFEIPALVKLTQKYLYSIMELNKFEQQISALNIIKMIFLPEHLKKYFQTETKHNKNVYYLISGDKLEQLFQDLSNKKIKHNIINQIHSKNK